MIRFITITTSVVLLTCLTIGMAKSNKNQNTETSNNQTAPACPYFQGTPSETVQEEIGSEYIHCKKCNTGVFLPHENNLTKCTFCGEHYE